MKRKKIIKLTIREPSIRGIYKRIENPENKGKRERGSHVLWTEAFNGVSIKTRCLCS